MKHSKSQGNSILNSSKPLFSKWSTSGWNFFVKLETKEKELNTTIEEKPPKYGKISLIPNTSNIKRLWALLSKEEKKVSRCPSNFFTSFLDANVSLSV